MESLELDLFLKSILFVLISSLISIGLLTVLFDYTTSPFVVLPVIYFLFMAQLLLLFKFRGYIFKKNLEYK